MRVKTAPNRHPCSPVEGSIETVKGYPSVLRLFRIGCSPFWYARVFIHGKYRKTSLKTVNKTVAIQRAKAFYASCFGVDAKVKHEVSGHKFDAIAQSVLAVDERRVKLGERAANSATNNRYTYERHIKAPLGGLDIQSINYDVLESLVNDLADKNLSSSSVKRFMSFVSKVLRQAYKLELIQRLPLMPAIKRKAGVRGWFSHQEYAQLLLALDIAIEDAVTVRHVVVGADLRYLVELMVQTMLRPSDVKTLKHRNIEIVDGPKPYLRINTADSKTMNSPVISTAVGVEVYKQLLAYQQQHGYGQLDDYLFYPRFANRHHANDMMRRLFAEVLTRAGLKKSPQGEPRTLYSLRHSAIMFAILKGDKNLLTIARNARTSPDMIDRFYGRHLTAEIAQISS